MHFRSVYRDLRDAPTGGALLFLLMWVLRHMGIVDIHANIKSLAGSQFRWHSRRSGDRDDENATHQLKQHFGDRKVTGDIRELVIAPCRTVAGRSSFSV